MANKTLCICKIAIIWANNSKPSPILPFLWMVQTINPYLVVVYYGFTNFSMTVWDSILDILLQHSGPWYYHRQYDSGHLHFLRVIPFNQRCWQFLGSFPLYNIIMS